MLSSKNRLTKREDFACVYSRGYYASINGITIKYLKTQQPFTRIGFAIGKNFSKKAVDRNRIRRLLREATRNQIDTLKPGYDIVMMAQSNQKGATLSEIKSTVHLLMKKANLFI